MENKLISSDNPTLDRSLKEKQLHLAIHGIGMVVISLFEYFLSFFFNLRDLEYWFSNVIWSYAWYEWLCILSMNVFLLPRLLFLYRAYEAKLKGNIKKMKQYRVLWLIVLICNIFIFLGTFWYMYFSKAHKPVIYLYPTEQTEVNVRLELDGRVTYSYPEYNNTCGWNVTAEPDGLLTNEDGNQYPYLFWEGDIAIKPDLSEGFCVKGEDTEVFLTGALRQLGLNDSEANDFIEYWLPEMEDNKYNVITFQTMAYEDVVSMKISPEPDTVIRVNMLWYSSNLFVDIAPQDLSDINPPNREGFTVVEWGGEEYKRGAFSYLFRLN